MHMFGRTFSKFHNTLEQTFFIESYLKVFEFLDKLQSIQTKTYMKICVTRFSTLLAESERERLKKLRKIKLEYDRGDRNILPG